MGLVLNAVQRGVARAAPKAPAGVFVAVGKNKTEVSVIKAGVVVGLRNWVMNTRTRQANCVAYHATAAVTPNDPLAQRLGPKKEFTLRGGSIEEIIWSVVMAVAMGVYDHVPE